MPKINDVLDRMNPTDSFVQKNRRIKEALAISTNASRISRPTVKDVMVSTKR